MINLLNPASCRHFMILSVLLLVCCSSADENKESGLHSGSPLRITAVKAEAEKLYPPVVTGGRISAYRTFTLSAPFPAEVKELKTAAGNRLEKDDIACILESPDIGYAIREAENAYTAAELTLRSAEEKLRKGRIDAESRLGKIRIAEAGLEARKCSFESVSLRYSNRKELHILGAVTDMDMNTMENEYQNAFSLYRQAELELLILSMGFRESDIPADSGITEPVEAVIRLNTREYEINRDLAELDLKRKKDALDRITDLSRSSILRAPADVVTARVRISEGEKVEEGEEVLSLIDNSRVMVDAGLSEKESEILQSDCSFRVSSGDLTVKAELRSISPFISRETGTRQIEIECIFLDSRSDKLLPGKYVEVEIQPVYNPKVLIIPSSCVFLNGENEELVFIVDSVSRIYRRRISCENRRDGVLSVSSGIDADELIWLHPDGRVRDGTEVNVYEG